jgi:transcriptional regulator with XRE-family HTH domain
MISMIERGESKPTSVLLERLASGLGVSLASLFEWPHRSARARSARLARGAEAPASFDALPNPGVGSGG